MNGHDSEEWQVRPLDGATDVYGVFDEWGRLLGAGSRETCAHFVELMLHPQLAAEYSAETLADLFERWRTALH